VRKQIGRLIVATVGSLVIGVVLAAPALAQDPNELAFWD